MGDGDCCYSPVCLFVFVVVCLFVFVVVDFGGSGGACT